MKLPTAIVIAKGLCYVLIGGLTPVASAVSQWQNDGSWPPHIAWVVIGSACLVGAATQLLSFLSEAYSDYLKQQNK